MRRLQTVCFFIVVLAFLMSGFVFAQGGATGAIAGTVQDATGVLAGCKHSDHQEATG